jgi:hypothetical protein
MELTMTKYTQEKKEHALRLMSAPQHDPVAEVAEITGVPQATLYLWRKQAREAGRVVPGDGQNPEHWSAADKLAAVLEAALLNEAELAEYCRHCKVMGFSRATFYRYQAALEAGGVDALFDANQRKPNLRNYGDESMNVAVKELPWSSRHMGRSGCRMIYARAASSYRRPACVLSGCATTSNLSSSGWSIWSAMWPPLTLC